MLIVPYAHNSPIANGAVGAGKRVFTLALPRSNNRPHITQRSEDEAMIAAAKLCQTHGVRIEKVWFEDGEHDELGLYRMWYIIAAPETRAERRRRIRGMH